MPKIKAPGKRHTSFEALGTRWSIAIFQNISAQVWSQLLIDIHNMIELFDQTYSRFRSDSWVTALSQKAGRWSLPPDAWQLLEFYKKLYEATGGLITPLIGQTIADAGYDAEYSFMPKRLQSPPTWGEVLVYDHKHITTRQPVLLDFGAAGKGYLVDKIGIILEKAGIENYVIDGSGDLQHRSAAGESISIGLENPRDTSEVVGITLLQNKSLCASAGSRRKWDSYHHIINPFTLHSPSNILATWVAAADTMTADGLSTALFFVSPEQLRQFDFSYAMLHQDMQLNYSKDFPLKTFEAD